MARGTLYLHAATSYQPNSSNKFALTRGEVVYQTSHPILCDDCLPKPIVGPSRAQAEPEPKEATEMSSPELRLLKLILAAASSSR
jgi:hypothetical protein